VGYGGRYGYHTEYLQPLLDEMTEVYRLDPTAEW
jgi:ring-1,2-phenylacetyl-CoA epoxidase subunit PaaC